MSAANHKVSVVGTIILHVTMGDARVTVVFRIARNLAVPVLIQTSFIDSFVKVSFSSEWKIVRYLPRLVQNLSIKDMLKAPKQKEKDRKQGRIGTEEEVPNWCTWRSTRRFL